MISNKYTNIVKTGINEAIQIRGIKDGWKEIKKSNSLVLSITKYKDYELKMSKLEGTIPSNIEKVQKYYFECLDAQKDCRQMCDKFTNIETLDQDNILTYFKIKGKLVVSPRELLGIQNRTRLSSNEILLTTNHIADHPSAPHNKDIVRAEGKVYAIFLTRINDLQTKIQVFFLMDPKGSILTSLVNSMIEQQIDGFIKDIEKIQKL